MLATGVAWAKATILEVATQNEINTLETLAICIFTLDKKKPLQLVPQRLLEKPVLERLVHVHEECASEIIVTA